MTCLSQRHVLKSAAVPLNIIEIKTPIRVRAHIAPPYLKFVRQFFNYNISSARKQGLHNYFTQC